MDARPYRPYGAENVQPSLHQKHKSTGNLASMASTASTAGFRGPAKRAAFGDVTNMSRAGGRDGAKKVHKAQSVLHLSQAGTQIGGNKENSTLNKNHRPSHKFQSNGKVAPLDVLVSNPPATKTKPEQTIYRETEEDSRLVVAPEEAAAQASRLGPKASFPLSHETLETRPRQPRHFKSQPQLQKQLQPSLRRTQSRQLERIAIDDASACSPEDSINLVAVPSSELSEIPSEENFVDAVDLPAHYDSIIEEVIEEEAQSFQHHSDLLAEMADQPVAVPVNFRDSTTHGLSEPEEEVWEEEEEEEEYYDDQDQAYTTAHSFRSRDMTTSGVTAVLKPRVTARAQSELDDAAMEVARTRPREDIIDEAWDVSMVAEYGDEIFAYLREMEIKLLPNPYYMDFQTEIQWSMRAVLMEWIVQVHGRFSLLPETLFLTVNYIDRFLSYKVVSIGKLQLVGATAILVASKYEEINCPSLEEIEFMVDGGYSGEEILKAERFMLSMLSFELGWPGPMSFLRRVSKADDFDLDTRTLAKYFLELTIMDERFVASPPSYLAAGAHCLSRLILNKGHWTKAHVHYSGYTWTQLKSLVTMMIECCDNPDNHHQAVYHKYAEKKFKEASLVVQHALDRGFTLPHHNQPMRPTEAQTEYFEDSVDHLRNQLLPMEA